MPPNPNGYSSIDWRTARLAPAAISCPQQHAWTVHVRDLPALHALDRFTFSIAMADELVHVGPVAPDRIRPTLDRALAFAIICH